MISRLCGVFMLVLVIVSAQYVVVSQDPTEYPGPVLWFKRVSGLHVELSDDGGYALVWDTARITLVTTEGVVKFGADFGPLILRSATFVPGGFIVCLINTTLLEGGEEFVTAYLIAYDLDGNVLWRYVKEGVFGVDARYVPNSSYIALVTLRRGEGVREVTLDLLTIDGKLVWGQEVFRGDFNFVLMSASEVGVAVSAGRTVKFLDLSGRTLWVVNVSTEITAMDIDTQGDVLVIGEYSKVSLVDGEGNVVWERYVGVPIFYMDVSDGGEYVVIGGWKGAWCFSSGGTKLWEYIHGADYVTPVAVSDDGRAVVIDNSKSPPKALLIDPNRGVLWCIELEELIAGFEADISRDSSLIAVIGGFGLYLLKGTGLPSPTTTLPKYSPINITIVNKGPHVWSAKTYDVARRTYILSNGDVIITTESHIHYVSRNGSLIWSKPLGNIKKVVTSPKGLLAIGLINNVILMNLNCTMIWSRNVGGSVEDLTIVNDYIITVTWGKVLILDLDGNLIKETSISTPSKFVGIGFKRGFVRSLGDFIVVVFSGNGSVIQALTTEGEPLWILKLDKSVFDLDLTSNGVVVGLVNGTLIALNLSSGEILWRSPGGLINEPVIDVECSKSGNPIVVAASKGGIIYAFSMNGTYLWRYPKVGTESMYRQVEVPYDGKYVITLGENLTVLNRAGDVVESIKIGEGGILEVAPTAPPNLSYVVTITSHKAIHYYELSKLLTKTTTTTTMTALETAVTTPTTHAATPEKPLAPLIAIVAILAIAIIITLLVMFKGRKS